MIGYRDSFVQQTSKEHTMTDYFDYVNKLVAEGKTSGENQSDDMIYYTQLAAKRMKRWLKTGELIPEMKVHLEANSEKQHWIVLTETWCGDAAHAWMFFEKMADASPNILLEWKLRDENLDLIDQHLTNGGRAIPKLISYDENGDVQFTWGPRPKHIQEKYWEMRDAELEYKEVMIELQKLYNEDKGQTMQKEILELLLLKDQSISPLEGD